MCHFPTVNQEMVEPDAIFALGQIAALAPSSPSCTMTSHED
jgi:hypothetical protein